MSDTKEYLKKSGAKTVLICNNCQWYASNPCKEDEEGNCAGCGKSYKETKSRIEYL